MAAPVDHKKLEDEIKKVEGVAGVHDLHVWTLVWGKNVAHSHVAVPTNEQNIKKYNVL